MGGSAYIALPPSTHSGGLQPNVTFPTHTQTKREALMDPNGPVVVVRIKDRISNPLDSGYRDVLLNLQVKGIGCDMIMELQLLPADLKKQKECSQILNDYVSSFR